MNMSVIKHKPDIFLKMNFQYCSHGFNLKYFQYFPSTKEMMTAVVISENFKGSCYPYVLIHCLVDSDIDNVPIDTSCYLIKVPVPISL